MKVCATILLGPGSEAIVGDAIASVVRHVDGFVFIESGGGSEALRIASEGIGLLPWTSRHFEWTGSYSDARQCALDWAGVQGYDWALTVDPDERILLAADWRSDLERSRVDVLMLRDRVEGYAKERFLRCKAGLRWHGRVCENVLVPTGIISGAFWELPKTPEQHEARYRRGIQECHRMIHDECDDRFKWWRHMGSCFSGLGNHLEAERCYREAYARAQHPEDRAWSAYLVAELLVVREAYQEAHDMAARELALHAGFLPEFGWILAYTQSKMGELQNAARWCQLVVSCPPDRTRVGNRGKQCRTGAGQLLSYLLSVKPAESQGE